MNFRAILLNTYTRFSFLIMVLPILHGAEFDTKNPLDLEKFCRTHSMASEMVEGIQKFFNPSSNPALSEVEMVEDVAIEIIKKPHPSSLLARASEFVDSYSSAGNPSLKSSEYGTIAEIAVRIGMHLRPEYFDLSLPLSAETGFIVANKFLQEFTQGGALDTWVILLKAAITPKESNEEQKAAFLELFDSITWFLKHIGSDDVHDPLKDPFDKKIRQNREKALEEGAKYMSSLLKRMRPELDPAYELTDILALDKKTWATSKRKEVEEYVLTEYGKTDLFEHVHLRNFWEKIARNQYNKVFYAIVCESFNEDKSTSPVHQLAQQIWCLSLLDTIHQDPKEAKSRMPAAAIDGSFAPNFGYVMSDSVAYQHWVKNPLARAVGDVIIDNFHNLVSIGTSIDIEMFLSRLELHLSDIQADKNNFFSNPHPYDRLLISFAQYLLEDIFDSSFIEGKDRTISKELQKAAGTRSNLLAEAKKALNTFKDFSDQMFALSPTSEVSNATDRANGLVFGIGFSGNHFDSPDFHESNNNKVWLNFSQSGRSSGGYLFLRFLVNDAYYGHAKLSHDNTTLDFEQCFAKYKPLIKQYLSQEIKTGYVFNDFNCDAHLLEYMTQKRLKFEDFMSLLEQDIPFEHLPNQLKFLIRMTKNWYRVIVDIEIPDEMPFEEYQVQHITREILFDALNSSSFSKRYEKLMPMLFLHWKEEILKDLAMHEEIVAAVRSAKELSDLPGDIQVVVLNRLDSIVATVHNALKTTLQPDFDEKFEEFIKPQKNPIENRLRTATATIKEINKRLKGLNKAKTNVSSKVEETTKELAKAKQCAIEAQSELEKLPKSPTDLSLDDYEKFKNKFFENRAVFQCIEPIFARVLGHDHFFAVFIAKDPAEKALTHTIGERQVRLQLGNTIPLDVIAPCNKRCQHHALGHLYVGDMLSIQSADRLDQTRHIHNLGGVPNRFMTFLD